MRNYFLSLLLFLFSLCSCGINTNKPVKESGYMSSKLDSLRKLSSPNDPDSLIKVWKNIANDPKMQKDTAVVADINYQIAKLYSSIQKDSSRLFIEKALSSIESTNGNLPYKVLIYNGVGNVCSMEGKREEACFYYNKGAAIVLADSSLGSSEEVKSSVLLSAAQSNAQTFQLALAEKMNRAALPYMDSLPDGHINKQRVLVQLIQVLNKEKAPKDSILPYLNKLEQLHASFPGKYNIAYLYSSKISYFEMIGNTDSLLQYQLLKTKLDEPLFQMVQNPVITNNVYVDYCNISLCYTQLKNIAKADEYMQKARGINEAYNTTISSENLYLFYQCLAGVLQLQGKKDDAIYTLKYAADLQKQIFQTKNNQAIAEMNALYQLQAKDQSIQALNENIQLNQLKLQQNRLWLVISVLGIGLLSVFVLFLFYRFRQRRAIQEKEKILLQQKLLRTQMEPHFIFNTLAAVQSFVRLDQKEQAIKYLNRFSRLLRSSLELSREDLVPLNEEIETLDNYLSLQQMRSEDAFTYTIQQPEEDDLGAVFVPPMLIQPYVENAILHGIDLDSGTGNIDVQFDIKKDILEVKISDTGKTESIDTNTAHKSLSGTISRERMQLLGKKANIQIKKNASGNGTLIILQIPISNT